MTDYKLVRHTWTRYFSRTYWRFIMAGWWGGWVGLNVVETFEFELPDKQPDSAPPQTPA